MAALTDLLNYTNTAALALGVITAVVTVVFAARQFQLRQWSVELERHFDRQATVHKMDNGDSAVSQFQLETTQSPKDLTKPSEAFLSRYHSQGLLQSQVSFWFSLIFASIGFVVIVSAVVQYRVDRNLMNQGPAVLTLIAGTIVDSVSALFFIQSNKARQLMVDFFDRLRSDEKLDKSLALAASMQDIALRNRLQVALSLRLADEHLGPPTLTTVLGGAPVPTVVVEAKP
jgi:hypothetical protein